MMNNFEHFLPKLVHMEAPNRFQVIYSDIKKVKIQMKSNPNSSLDLRKEIKTNKVTGLLEKHRYYYNILNIHIYVNTFTSNFLSYS